MATWRERARPIIAQVVLDVGFKDGGALRKALTAAYPFGDRKGWPYKAWLAEVRQQVGRMRAKKKDPSQLELF